MDKREEFVSIYKKHINREGADKLLDYLLSPSSDFFEAPASTRFHGAYAGGLCEHSVNVYHCLKAYLERDRVKETYGLSVSDESIAVSALLHDLCKVNCYKPGTRNVKENGVWIWAVEAGGKPYYEQDFRGACALILGSEGEGVSDILKKDSDFIAGIPMYGTVNSLNVSNAGAIVMFEAAKQRNS